MFLPRSMERQAGHDGETVFIDRFQKKVELIKIFCAYFLSCIYYHQILLLCIFAVYLFSQMPFKRKFRVYLNLQNRPKFAKFAKICTVR